MTTPHHRRSNEQARAFAVDAARLMADRHCEDICVIDVRGLSQVCDFVLIGTGTSDRQMQSVGRELEDLGASSDQKPFRSHSDSDTTWIVIDFVDVVAHLFEPGRRAYYDLETLWSDGARIDWQRESAA